MVRRIKPTSKPLHERNFYVWPKAQADLLRARRFTDLDLDHLGEEIEDLADEALKRSVRNRILTIVKRLVKLQHSPAQDPRAGWYDTIFAKRNDLLDEITQSIRREVEPTLPELYGRARQNGATSLHKHGEHAAAAALPASCPYTFDQITGDWQP